MTPELTYQIECGPEDILYTFVYDFTPGCKGSRDEPAEGPLVDILEVRNPDGSTLPPDSWAAAGIDEEKMRDRICEYHCERERDRYAAAQEDRADERRERRMED